MSNSHTFLIEPARQRDEAASASTVAITRGSSVYLVAWVVGLALVPTGVTSSDTPAAVVASYLDHRTAAMAQVALVHGVAAIALVVLAVALGRHVAPAHPRMARWTRWAGSLAAALSLVQAAVGLGMIASAGSVDPSATHGLLVAIERLDALKLTALAALCGAGVLLGRVAVLPRWTGWVAAGGCACLLLAAAALSGAVPALAPVAVPALLLLLLWVGALPFAVRRGGA